MESHICRTAALKVHTQNCLEKAEKIAYEPGCFSVTSNAWNHTYAVMLCLRYACKTALKREKKMLISLAAFLLHPVNAIRHMPYCCA